MTIVVDASTVVAALVDSGPDGRWAEAVLADDDLVAPHLMPAEVASVLRRAALAGHISDDTASLAHRDLMDLRLHLYPYDVLAARTWELRRTVTPYDAWYVALAESLDCPIATLDVRLSGAPGPRCPFITPSTLAPP